MNTKSKIIITSSLLLILFFSTYAQEQSGEVRGIWLHPSYFGADQKTAVPKIQSTLDGYVQAGINTVMVLVKSTSGALYYKSQIGSVDTAWNWDFFGRFLQEAQKRHIVVHPWFCVFTEGGRLGQVKQHPEWLIRSKEGTLVGVVNPALPQVREYELALMKELVSQYPVDWIHLDYIRYPCDPAEVYFSFDEQTRGSFKEFSGVDPLAIKAMDSGNIMWNEWIEWNASHVTAFVRELKEALGSSGRPIKISAAVFPNAENARVLIAQNWAEWAKEGLIDMLCPMLYTNDDDFFRKYTERAVGIARAHSKVCVGIGIGTAHNQNTPAGMSRQIKISRDLASDGFVFFSSSSLTHEFLEELGKLNH